MTGLAAGTCVVSAAALLGLSRLESWRARAYATCFVFAAALAVMLVQPFKPRAMGDYSVFTRDRDYFKGRFIKAIEFQYHLGGVIIDGLDKAFGRTAHSPIDAFHTLARLASVAFLLGLLALAFQQRFAPRVLRYMALVVAAPTTLLFFGYAEFGYLPAVFIVCGIPLALIGLEEKKDAFVLTGAVLLGVGAALHGFGVVSGGFLLLIGLFWERRDPRRMLSRLVSIVGGFSFGWLCWLALDFMTFKIKVTSGHADQFPVRPLFHTRVDLPHGRYDYAIFSSTGLRDILFEFIILGVFVTAFLLFFTRGDRLWQAVTAATLPVFVFVIVFWPVQGLGNDTDFLGAAFPSLYAAGWLGSRSKRLSFVAVAVLAVSQLAMLYVVHGNRFVHSRDFG